MLKHSLIAFIVLVGLFACKENNPTNSGFDSIRKVTDIPLDTTKHGTTLDSLQGEWISNNDNQDILVIKLHTHAEVYQQGNNTDMATTKFYLNDSCETNINKLDTAKANGNFMILAIPENPLSTLCYQIDYIDDKHLVLINHGKTISYFRK